MIVPMLIAQASGSAGMIESLGSGVIIALTCIAALAFVWFLIVFFRRTPDKVVPETKVAEPGPDLMLERAIAEMNDPAFKQQAFLARTTTVFNTIAIARRVSRPGDVRHLMS